MVAVNFLKQGACNINANKTSYFINNKADFSVASNLKIKSIISDQVCFSGKATPQLNKAEIKRLLSDSSISKSPYIIVHGTVLSKESISKVDDFLKSVNLKSDCSRYPTITEGQKLEISALEVSKKINKERISITKKNLQKLNKIINHNNKLIEHFNIDKSAKYENYEIKNLIKILPNYIKQIDKVIKNNCKKELENTFSTRIHLIEKELSNQLLETGFGNWNIKLQNKLCNKAANEIINSISPKAILVGHSMGGFVNYTVALNPKEDLNDSNPFKYDGGNGINAVLTLASPVNNGISYPLPETYSGLMYDLINEDYVEPMEKEFKKHGLFNNLTEPITDFWKSIFKSTIKAYTNMSAIYLNNFVYQKSPGYKQIAENSDFVKDYIKGKNVPEGITAISFYHPLDGISEMHKSKLNEDFNNHHNIKTDIPLNNEDLKSEKSKDPQMTLSHHAHRVIATEPVECIKALKKELSTNTKMLNIENNEGFRQIYLKAIDSKLKKDPTFLIKNNKLAQLITEVAKERLPFNNSASKLALTLTS